MLSGIYIKLIAGGIILAVVLGGWWYVSGLQNKVNTLTTEKAVLEGKILTQNAAIKSLQDEAIQQKKDNEAAVAAAKAETAAAKGRATIIYKTRPSDPSDPCKSALDLMNGVTK